jgi:Ca2+-binding RTX toxin-like protein
LFGDDGEDIILSDNVTVVIPFAVETPETPVDVGYVKFDLKYMFKDIAGFLHHHHHHGDKRFEILSSDTIEGGEGDDVLVGQYGRNNVFGGEGCDVLYGHKHKDILDGGPGSDEIKKSHGKAPKSVLELLQAELFGLLSAPVEYFLLDVAAAGLHPPAGGDASPGGFEFEDVVSELNIYAYGPTAGVRGQPLQYGAIAETPGVLGRNLTRWRVLNGDGAIIALGSGEEFTFYPVDAGLYTVMVGSTDGSGTAGVARIDNVLVEKTRTIDDPAAPGKVILMVGGSSGDDDIELERGYTAGIVRLELDERDFNTPKLKQNFADVSRIVVYGQDGDDDIHIDDNVGPVPVEFYGGAGKDELDGGDGDDLLDGGAGDDDLDGKDGNDVLRGRHGNDDLEGGRGDDVLHGDLGEGQDTLKGEDGDDTLFGADGDDVLKGGDDDDTFVIRNTINGDEIRIDGDRNTDTLDLSAYSDDRVTISRSTVTIDLGATEFSTIKYSSISAVITGPGVGIAGPDQSVHEQTEVTLSAAGGLAYSWTQLTGPTVTLFGADTASSTFIAPDITTITALTFELEISYGPIGSATDTVAVTVNPDNDAPDAVNDPVVTDEDTTVITGNLLANDTDPNADTLSVQSLAPASHGTVGYNGYGKFTYAPQANYNGPDSFTYVVTDDNGGADTATVNITVNPVNDAPVAGDNSTVTDEDTPVVTGNVLLDDTDIDADTLSIHSFTHGAHGSVVDNADGTLTYSPQADYNGPDSFTYIVTDGMGGTDVGTVTVTVNPVNDAPVAIDDWVITDEDTAIAIGNLLTNDKDVDGDDISIQSMTLPTNGVLVDNADGTFTYTPNANYNGPDSFTYTITDGNGEMDTATVNLTVNAVNDAPNAVDNSVVTDEDTPVVTGNVLADDTDIEGDILSIQSFTQGASGSVVDNADGTLTYSPHADYNGPDRFTYTVTDGNGGADTATVTVTVNAVNDAPVAAGDSVITDEDFAVTTGDVLADDTDVEGDDLSIQSFTQPAHGTVVDNADGTFTYTPNVNYNGLDSFTYTVVDGNGGSDTATVAVTVNPDNDRYDHVIEGTEVTLDVGRSTDPADLQPVADGGEVQVNTSIWGDQMTPSIGIAGDGSYVVVWVGYDARRKGVLAQRFDADGSAVGGEFQVNTRTSGDQKAPSIAMAFDGRFVVAWEGFDANKKGVFAQRFDAAGAAIGGEFRVNTSTSGDQKAPSIALAADGSFVVAWEGIDANKKGIFAQRFDAAGNAAGGEIQVNATTSGDQAKPSIAVEFDGGFVVAWEGLDANRKGVFAQRFDADGNAIGGEFQINTRTSGDQDEPSAALAADGSFVIAWEGFDSNGKGVFAQRFDVDGNAAGGEFQVNTAGSGDQTRPEIAMHNDGRFVIAWEGSDTGGKGVFAQAYTADGVALGDEFQVNTAAPGDQKTAAVAMADDGGFVVAWEGVDAHRKGVFAQRYDSGESIYSWTQIGGPGVTLSNANIANPTFIAPDVATITTLTFEVGILDGTIFSTEFITVIVHPV